MIHLCLFGGQGGQIGDGRKVYMTLFGGCEVRRPTVARQLVEAQQHGQTNSTTTGPFFITFFGGTSVKAPTLAQEYLDLQDALRSGILTMDQWDRTIARVFGQFRPLGSLTLFGSFDGDELPSEDEELDDMALNRHLGQIPDDAVDLLMPAVGQRGATRTASVRQALASTLAQ
ncbi:MAG: hypothetical protein ABIG44_17460 [Planctomycetota bacterium]